MPDVQHIIEPKWNWIHRLQVISIITERLYDPSHHGWINEAGYIVEKAL